MLIRDERGVESHDEKASTRETKRLREKETERENKFPSDLKRLCVYIPLSVSKRTLSSVLVLPYDIQGFHLSYD